MSHFCMSISTPLRRTLISSLSIVSSNLLAEISASVTSLDDDSVLSFSAVVDSNRLIFAGDTLFSDSVDELRDRFRFGGEGAGLGEVSGWLSPTDFDDTSLMTCAGSPTLGIILIGFSSG